MSDDPAEGPSLPVEAHPLLRDAQQNLAIGEADARASAHYATNTMLITVSPEDLVAMTIMYALVSREEFLHGEWNEALLNTTAHLKQAAADQLLAALGEGEIGAHMRSMFWALQVAYEIDRVTHPFIEAVDRFHIISTVGDDDEYYESVKRNYEAVVGEGDGTDIERRLRREIEEQRAIARGETRIGDGETVVRGGDGPESTEYVNPLYYHALTEIARTDWLTATEIGETTRSTYTPNGQLIAETVAKAVLDVPYPIRPLGSFEATELFDPERVDLEPISIADLRERVAVDDATYERYLGRYEGRFDADVTPARTWLSDMFVRVMQELEWIAEAESVTAPTGEELRRRLVERVFADADLTDAATMRDRPSPLLEVPQRAQATGPDRDFSEVDDEPLAKLLVEAFEEHGAFANVLYPPYDDREGGRTDHQFNYNTLWWELDRDRYSLPEGVDTYRELWDRYFFGDTLVNHLLRRRDEYREHLLERLGEAAESTADLHAIVTGDSGRRDPDPTEAEFALFRDETLTDAIDAADDEFDAADAASEYATGTLLTAVERAGIDHVPVEQFEFRSIPCPFCVIQEGRCGTDGCAEADTIRRLNDDLPAYVSALLDAERAAFD